MSVSKNRRPCDPVEVPYLRVANVQRGFLVLDQITSMPVERMALPELRLEEWDVLFTERGDRDKLGRGWVWEGQLDCCITQNHVFRARAYLRDSAHAKFISYWGNTFGKDYFERGGKQTTNLASINKTTLGMFPVPLPPLAEQREIIRIIEENLRQIDGLEGEIERGLRQSEMLRRAILTQAFSGKLVPQDPEDEPASVLLERIQAQRAAEQAKAKPTRPRRKKQEPKTMTDLLTTLKDHADWTDAATAFRECGITDGADTDQVERLYRELRELVVAGKVQVERREDEDWLRATATED
jgi:type I restriction enzyme S subunit